MTPEQKLRARAILLKLKREGEQFRAEQAQAAQDRSRANLERLGMPLNMFEPEPAEIVPLEIENIEYSEIVKTPVKVESIGCGTAVIESRD